jgi:hypothetical protein
LVAEVTRLRTPRSPHLVGIFAAKSACVQTVTAFLIARWEIALHSYGQRNVIKDMEMLRKTSCVVGVLLVLVLVASVPVSARMARDPIPYVPDPNAAANPAYCLAEHNIGKLVMSINNNGTFGVNYAMGGLFDCFTLMPVESCEYPKGSNTTYMYGSAFWIGAVVGRSDTLVSVGADGWQNPVSEMHPDEPPLGNMIFRSNIDPAKPEYQSSVSEQDYIAVYSDTFTGNSVPGLALDFISGRPHVPLWVEVTQRSYAWSYEYAEDFILFDYSIRNIGHERLTKVYMGVYVDADVAVTSQLGQTGSFDDDLTGFREKAPATYLPSNCAPDSDVVFAAWIADNDGDLGRPAPWAPVPAITATRIVRTPSESLKVSYNWWVGDGQVLSQDFGPQSIAKRRDLGTGAMGTPEGDANKYWYMSNGEFDYDQIKTADITRYLLSFGPFNIEPGQTLPLSFAYVAGDNFHQLADNANNLPPGDWRQWYENVSFTDLDKNCTWADWIYDNPGVDTDSDGYFGEFTLCNGGGDSTLDFDTTIDSSVTPPVISVDTFWAYELADTVWRKGDGVPDFRGASPPPAPALRVFPATGEIRVVWNGVRSENTKDIFSRELDFEGYRVYYSRDERELSYTMLASYDREDYNRWTWDSAVADFRLLESPFSLQQLLDLYSNGDTTWHPLNYTRSRPFVDPNDNSKIYYFEPQDYNRSILANYPNATTPIRKVYPDAPRPQFMSVDSVPDSLWDVYVTPDGFFKYYEYEYTIQDLLPSVPYWVNVTAFDYGSPRSGLKSLESSRTISPQITYALPSVDKVAENNLKVFVYPNPYRTDADYQGQGFEGRAQIGNRSADRLRVVHFANLPAKCTIRIYSLDGDLIREKKHDFDPADPLANHDTWDLITRNTQLVVSGLYYWSVEDDQGNTQIGKLVIVM